MLVFPLIYVYVFLIALYDIFKGKQESALLYIIFGLPIYITALSLAFMYGFGKWIPYLQVFKESIIAVTFCSLVFTLHKKVKFLFFDWLVIAYAGYNVIYMILPIGIYNLYEKIVAFKNISFFPFIYFVGRLIDPVKVNLNRVFFYIAVVQIGGTLILADEVLENRHLQTLTGYADYIYFFQNVTPSGSYGLTMTFEADNGIKRFASLFSNPLENAAATIITLASLCALSLGGNNQFKANKFMWSIFICSLFSVVFAFSRASLISFFVAIYFFALFTEKKVLLRLLHGGLIVSVLLLFILKGDIINYALSTIDFSNSSSVAHIISWIEGIEAMITHPLGLGLGSSGRVGSAVGLNIGGENELIIIGVQSGLVAMLLYLAMHVYAIKIAFKVFKQSTGKVKKVAMFVLLLKIGWILPLLTGELESCAYIAYITWFFTGYMINLQASYEFSLGKKAIGPLLKSKAVQHSLQ